MKEVRGKFGGSGVSSISYRLEEGTIKETMDRSSMEQCFIRANEAKIKQAQDNLNLIIYFNCAYSYTQGLEQTGSHNTQLFRARSYSYRLSDACAPVKILFYGGFDGYDTVFCLI
jgi:hypothetical protein